MINVIQNPLLPITPEVSQYLVNLLLGQVSNEDLTETDAAADVLSSFLLRTRMHSLNYPLIHSYLIHFLVAEGDFVTSLSFLDTLFASSHTQAVLGALRILKRVYEDFLRKHKEIREMFVLDKFVTCSIFTESL